MPTLYFKTKKDSETGIKMNDLIQKGEQIKTEILKYVDELGAKDYASRGRCIFGTGIVAVEFREKPDMKIWKYFKDFQGYFQPRMSSKIGKEIQLKFESFETIERDDVNKIIGFDSFIEHCGYGISNDEYFGFSINSDWKHKMLSDCEEVTYTEYHNNFN